MLIQIYQVFSVVKELALSTLRNSFSKKKSKGNKTKYVHTSSYLWHLEKDKDKFRELQDQFAPFVQNIFGVTEKTFRDGCYNGTIFRFPLRAAYMKSNISDTEYDIQKVHALFDSLETESHLMLLFLKNLECIEVYENMSERTSPSHLMTVKVSSSTETIVQNSRQKLLNEIIARDKVSFSVTYPMSTELSKQSSPLNSRDWVISQFCGGLDEMMMISEISDTLRLLPWVGVALPVQPSSSTVSLRLERFDKPQGHIFCFLPLPLESESPTGLKFHVHGYFAMDSNRRHLKWETPDQNVDTLKDKDIIWNRFLVAHLLPKALVNLSNFVTKDNDRAIQIAPENVYALIPNENKIKAPHWLPLAHAFLSKLPKLEIFYSKISGGKYLQIKNALFDNEDDKSKQSEVIRSVLLQDKKALVSVPTFVFEQLGLDAQSINPSLVCSSLKNVQQLMTLSDDERMTLLNYFLKKLNEISFEQLIGARLLPLADGSWIEFKSAAQAEEQEKIYVDTGDHQRSLLPGVEKRFLMSKVQEDLLSEVRELAQRSKF